MKKFIHKTLFTTILASTVSLVSITNAHSETLKEELILLLDTHPNIKAGESSLLAAEEGIKTAFSEYLPTVQATGNFGYERIDSPGRRTATDPETSPFTTGQARNAKVTITQVLFNGFRNDANNSTAKHGAELAKYAIENSKQAILLEGISTYLSVIRNFKLYRLASNNEETIRKQLELEDERVRRGAGIAVDVLQSKSTLQVAKERRVAFEGQLENSISQYEQVFGHPPYPQNLVMPTPPLGLIPETVDEVIEIALAENPALLSQTISETIASDAKKIARADYFPTIDVSGEWNYEDDLSGTRGTRRDYKAKVNASWTLFNGFATRYGVAAAAYNYKSTLDIGNGSRRKITESARLSWTGLKTARERVSLLQNAVNIAAEVFDARKKLRDAGKETVINVLGAESELFNAKINLVSAQHDARLTVYSLLLAMGRLTLDSSTNLTSISKPKTYTSVKIIKPNQESKNIDRITKEISKLEISKNSLANQNKHTKVVSVSTSIDPKNRKMGQDKENNERNETSLEELKQGPLNEMDVLEVTKGDSDKSKLDNSNNTSTLFSEEITFATVIDANFTRLWPYK